MRPTIALTLALTLLAVALPGCRKDTQSAYAKADLRFRAGWEYMAQGQLLRARQEFELAISMYDQDAHYFGALGLCHYFLGNYDIAEKRLLQAMAISSGIPDFYNNLANVYLAQERYEEAISKARAALDNPAYKTPGAATYVIGAAYEKMGNREEALRHYHKALNHDPEFPSPYIRLAAIALEERDCTTAFKYIRTAGTLVTDKNNPDLFLVRGKVFLCFDKRLEAVDALLTVTEIAPESEQAAEARELLNNLRDRQSTAPR
jgi:type IV pilus assembly protein PilF